MTLNIVSKKDLGDNICIYTLSHQDASSEITITKEPFFRIDQISISDLSVIQREIKDHEDDPELTNRNHFLAIRNNSALKVFLQNKQPLLNATTAWYPLEDPDSAMILKITDHTRLYHKTNTTTTAYDCIGDEDEETITDILSQKLSDSATLIVCRMYDIVTQEYYWSVYQIILQNTC